MSHCVTLWHVPPLVGPAVSVLQSHPRGPGVSHPRGPGVSHPRDPGVSQHRGPLAGCCLSMTWRQCHWCSHAWAWALQCCGFGSTHGTNAGSRHSGHSSCLVGSSTSQSHTHPCTAATQALTRHASAASAPTTALVMLVPLVVTSARHACMPPTGQPAVLPSVCRLAAQQTSMSLVRNHVHNRMHASFHHDSPCALPSR